MTTVRIKRPKRQVRPSTDDEPRPHRAITESIVETAHYAMAEPGKWIKLNRSFKTRANAHSTASCIRRGFLRVRPEDGDPTFLLGEHTYLALPAKPEVKVEHKGETWRLSLRVWP